MSDLLLNPAAHSFLTLLQGVINRFAANSSNCKTWCITLVSAIVVLSVDKHSPDGLTIAYIPVCLFLFLDAYYLSMERDAIKIYNEFVKKPHESALFKIPLPECRLRRAWETGKAILSFSVFPGYLLIAGALHLCGPIIRS